jgi:hypothetical protein
VSSLLVSIFIRAESTGGSPTRFESSGNTTMHSCWLLVVGTLISFSATSSAAFTLRPRYNAVEPLRSSTLSLLPPEVSSVDLWSTSAVWLSQADATAAHDTGQVIDDGLLSKNAIVSVFLVGLIPFAVATVEFWRRIAVGDSFGTGSESVVITTIGEEDAPLSSRGQRVLGKGALVTAYILFAAAAAVLALVLFAVLTSPDNMSS